MPIKTPVTKQEEFVAYSVGICAASVCTSLSIEEATERLNREKPTGIESQWTKSEDEYFNGVDKEGQKAKNGCDCPDYPGNKHYLFNC